MWTIFVHPVNEKAEKKGERKHSPALLRIKIAQEWRKIRIAVKNTRRREKKKSS
jgi:hypothetical protein